MQVLQQFDDSRFWKRLAALSSESGSSGAKEAIDHLKASVRKVANRAAWINSQVCRYMPQYTLHEERHFLNVLGIMDSLVPDEVIHQLTPLECALPIFAAYTHDLGMALSEKEKNKLFDESTEEGKHFLSYKSRFDEELTQIERWNKRNDELKHKADCESQKTRAEAEKRIGAMEGHVLSNFLRDTHTDDDQIRRLRNWLEAIKNETGDANLFHYGDFPFQREIALLGISHGRSAPWLRKQIVEDGPEDSFYRPVASGESTQLAFAGLMLRLADLMDFDSSRAPRILFKHFGIENEHSVLEWNKHLSITGWDLRVDPSGKEQPDLIYTSHDCQHPVHEKAIKDFACWIDAELSAVRIELDAQRRQLPAAAQQRYDLHLPSKVRLDIRPARDPLTDRPTYVYHDLQFRLDQDEIQQLLMGESLYGDPGLCIRELLQNALDALELRELRLKMKQKGAARASVDGELIRPGWIREPDGREEELRVTLDWGTDEQTGQQWLRVTDNGVGMTEEVIKNYFTQIGKSYYRSPEFNQERAAMKVAGEVVSPISTFGIGILSCFMISDRLKVRTRAGGLSATSGLDVEISGSGSLFWMRSGTLSHQGTEITLFAKNLFHIAHNKLTLLNTLQEHFRGDTASMKGGGRRTLDPILIAGAYFVWPRYSITLQDRVDVSIRVDNRFHLDVLFPINLQSLFVTSERWGCPRSFFRNLGWISWDWTDSDGEEATGSRVRICFSVNDRDIHDNNLPNDSDDTNLCRQDEVAALIEASFLVVNRKMILVNGMFIPDTKVCGDLCEGFTGVGTYLWLDLCGAAAPRLTTDRQQMLLPADETAYRQTLDRLIQRMQFALLGHLKNQNLTTWRNVLCGLSANQLGLTMPTAAPCTNSRYSLIDSLTTWPMRNEESRIEFLQQRYVQYLSRNPAADVAAVRGMGSLLDGARGLSYDSDPVRIRDRSISVTANLAADLARDLEPLLEDAIRAIPGLARLHSRRVYDDEAKEMIMTPPYVEIMEAFWSINSIASTCSHASILQQAFHSDLSSSWPALGLFHLRGSIAAGRLIAPAVLEFKFQSNGHTLRDADTEGRHPESVVSRGYNLVFPMTSVPLNDLRRNCTDWGRDRWVRSLGIAPFLLPAFEEIWRGHSKFLRRIFRVPYVFALLARYESWGKSFDDWSREDWNQNGHVSALWNVESGTVLWMEGGTELSAIKNRGRRANDFFVS